MKLRTYTSLSAFITVIGVTRILVTTEGNGYALLATLLRSKLGVLLLVNAGLNALFVVARVVSWALFGPLRLEERECVVSTMRNYVAWKFVFLFAVLRSDVRELLVWTSWFAVMGLFKFLTALSGQRLAHLICTGVFSLPSSVSAASASSVSPPKDPNQGSSRLSRTLLALGVPKRVISGACLGPVNGVLVAMALPGLGSLVLGVGAVFVFASAGLSQVCLLLMDPLQLLLASIAAVIRTRGAQVESSQPAFPSPGTVYSVTMASDASQLALSAAHYVHLIASRGANFGPVTLLLLLALKGALSSLAAVWNDYSTYVAAASYLDSLYQTLTPAQAAAFPSEHCSICAEPLAAGAKVLPCSHMFHRECLLSLLRHGKPSCPNCRYPLVPGIAPSSYTSPSSSAAASAFATAEAAAVAAAADAAELARLPPGAVTPPPGAMGTRGRRAGRQTPTVASPSASPAMPTAQPTSTFWSLAAQTAAALSQGTTASASPQVAGRLAQPSAANSVANTPISSVPQTPTRRQSPTRNTTGEAAISASVLRRRLAGLSGPGAESARLPPQTSLHHHHHYHHHHHHHTPTPAVANMRAAIRRRPESPAPGDPVLMRSPPALVPQHQSSSVPPSPLLMRRPVKPVNATAVASGSLPSPPDLPTAAPPSITSEDGLAHAPTTTSTSTSASSSPATTASLPLSTGSSPGVSTKHAKLAALKRNAAAHKGTPMGAKAWSRRAKHAAHAAKVAGGHILHPKNLDSDDHPKSA